MKDANYQGNQRIDKRLPDNLRDQVAEVDKDINCRAFIKLIFDDLQSRGENYRSTSLVSIFDSTKVLEINPRIAGYTNGGANAVRKGEAGYIYFGAVLSQYLGNTVAELSHLGKAGSDDYSDRDLDKATLNVLGSDVVKLSNYSG